MAAADNSNLASVTPGNFKMNSFVKTIFGAALAVGLAAIESPAQNAMNAGSRPLFFEAGQGPADAMAPFVAHGPDSEFLISATGAQFVLRKASGQTAAARMQFVGANPAAQVAGDAELSGKVNYLTGNHPAQWQSGISTFAKVRVAEIYPGVNVVYYGNGRQLEYDFDLAAGVDPKTIAIHFDGAERISVNPQGELVVSLNGGNIVQHRPVAYQNTGGARQEIAGGYQLLDAHTATFALGSYDHSQPLVIDPVLSYSTYFGGNYGDIIHAIALDKNGNIYVAGETLSTKFTNSVSGNAPSGYQPVFQGAGPGGVGDAFVAKFDNMGSNFIYFTYLGGSADDAAYGLAVDNSGNAYVTGATTSTNFPTQNALFSHISPIIHIYTTDAFVTELNASGSGLVYSTYLGGDASDIGKAIAVDTNGAAYVAGYTYSTNFPVSAGAYQSRLLCTNSLYINANAFVAKIAPGGTALSYSSYFGGTNFDEATAIALDASNYIYVAGYTASTNFPAKNPLPGFSHLDGSINPIPAFDAFVAKFQPGYANLVYATYLGGTNNDVATGIAARNGNAYVVGWTVSTNFPYTSASTNYTSFVRTNGTYYILATNSFLTEITNTSTTTGIGFSVMFGGYGADVANGVGLDAAGNIFVVGSASSTNYPVTTNLSGYLRATNSGYNPLVFGGTSDVVISAFNTNASALLYSAYLGGSGSPYNPFNPGGGNDFGNAIAVDPAGNAYIAGQTWSTNFPTVNARQPFLAGTNDAFIAKILLLTQPPVLNLNKLNPTNAVVSWPGFLPEFLLETRTNLIAGNPWAVVPQAVVVSNLLETVTVNDTNNTAFFRLHKH
jgi:hypothetical protein